MPTFCPREQGGGGCKMSTLVHSRGEGGEIGQNMVHVVVESPLGLIPKYKPETEIAITSCIVGGGSKDLGGVFGVGGRSLRGRGHVVSTVKKIF